MTDELRWTQLAPLLRIMWRSAESRRRGAAALDRQWPGYGAWIAREIDLLERATTYDADALVDVSLVREAARAGERNAQRRLGLMRALNDARKTQDDVSAAAPTIDADPYHRLA